MLKNRITFFVALFFSTILIFTSCERDVEDPDADNGSSYMPLSIGKWILYDVDSIYWDDFTKAMIPVHIQQRYEITDTFRDTEGRLSYTINVYRRESALTEFTPDNVIHVTKTNTRLEWSQRNLTFIPMIYPVVEGVNWNGLAKINLDDPSLDTYSNYYWNFHYIKSNEPLDLGVKYYNNTVTVDQIDESLGDPESDSTSYAYKNYSKEIFAYNVGMVYKERTFWTYQPTVGYRNGYQVIMKAVAHN